MLEPTIWNLPALSFLINIIIVTAHLELILQLNFDNESFEN